MKKKLLHVVACLFALSQANMSSATNQVNLGNILGTATQALENLTATDKYFSASSSEVSGTNVYGPLLRHGMFLVGGLAIVLWMQRTS